MLIVCLGELINEGNGRISCPSVCLRMHAKSPKTNQKTNGPFHRFNMNRKCITGSIFEITNIVVIIKGTFKLNTLSSWALTQTTLNYLPIIGDGFRAEIEPCIIV